MSPQQQYAQGTLMKRGYPQAGKASAAETASTTGPWIDTKDAGSLYVKLTVSAVSGTSPTMLIWIEGSADGVNPYTIGKIGNTYSIGTTVTDPALITAPITVEALYTAPQFIRYRSVIGGTTPSFTYKIDLETC